jgi:hypothetical protein
VNVIVQVTPAEQFGVGFVETALAVTGVRNERRRAATITNPTYFFMG